MTAPAMPWLVTFEVGTMEPVSFDLLEDALDHMRDYRGNAPVLWTRSDIGLVSHGAEPEPAPKKRAARRKRKDSPAPEQPPQTTPAANAAPEAGDVRPPAAAVTPPAIATPAPGPARPTCGGKACEVRADGKEVHRQDASCSKFAITRKLAR